MRTHATRRQRGASGTEIVETAFITAALHAGAAVTHGALALKRFDQTRGNKR
jgi:alkylhydroperoxidase/carboxymuconolactone decarboxylase family protein YurZ